MMENIAEINSQIKLSMDRANLRLVKRIRANITVIRKTAKKKELGTLCPTEETTCSSSMKTRSME